MYRQLENSVYHNILGNNRNKYTRVGPKNKNQLALDINDG